MTNDPIHAALKRLIGAGDRAYCGLSEFIISLNSQKSCMLPEYETQRCELLDALCAARAALAEQQGEGPSDEELIRLAIDTRLYRFQATAGDPIQYEMTEQQVHAFARAVLARWGHQPAPALNQVIAGPATWTDFNAPHCRFLTANDLPEQQDELERLKTPPAEGEVGEFLADLRNAAHRYFDRGFFVDARRCARAAELLQQQHPTPVPVSERFPEAGDCDAEGRCWWFCPASIQPNGLCPYWCLAPMYPPHPWFTHWLPTHALPMPMPQGEVE